MFPSFSFPEINKSPPPKLTFSTSKTKSITTNTTRKSKDGDPERAKAPSPTPGTSANLQPLPIIYFDDCDASAEIDSDETITGTRSFNRFQFSSLPDLGKITMQDSTEEFRKKKLTKRIRRSTHEILKKLRFQLPPGSEAREKEREEQEQSAMRRMITPFSFQTVVPPLKAHLDLQNSIGRGRGVCSSCIEWSYLDVTFFTLFYFTDGFDAWILDELTSKQIPNEVSRDVRRRLSHEVIYSLRSSFLCPAQHITNVHDQLFQAPALLQGQEMSKFLRALLELTLDVEDTTHYTNGESTVLHPLKYPKTDPAPPLYTKKRRKPVYIFHSSVQELFEASLQDLKLLSVPSPGLFLCLKGIVPTPHSVIIPNLQLDLSKLLITMRDDDSDDDNTYTNTITSTYTTYSGRRAGSSSGRWGEWQQTRTVFDSAPCVFLISICKRIYSYMQNLAISLPSFSVGFDGGSLARDSISLEDSWAQPDARTPLLSQRKKQSSTPPPILSETVWKGQKLPQALDLSAILCVCPDRAGHYAYVRAGENPRRGWAPWVLFDSIDGAANGLPLVRRVEEIPRWLRRLERKPEMLNSNPGPGNSGWFDIPPDVRNLLTNSTVFVYQPQPNFDSQNTHVTHTLVSFVNEKPKN